MSRKRSSLKNPSVLVNCCSLWVEADLRVVFRWYITRVPLEEIIEQIEAGVDFSDFEIVLFHQRMATELKRRAVMKRKVISTICLVVYSEQKWK
ncbi:hypothetical protein GE061_018227 [Apolygus lucorum]|uniref:Uncharacterized protein n=1 Tax=Apolygus lucorum TaxID=248454 RepID=A0A8S9XD61_APOLU|nr:hypothetical protein GE061_018227 [Apolygus lucorum]